jgi:hypothetical protein
MEEKRAMAGSKAVASAGALAVCLLASWWLISRTEGPASPSAAPTPASEERSASVVSDGATPAPTGAVETVSREDADASKAPAVDPGVASEPRDWRQIARDHLAVTPTANDFGQWTLCALLQQFLDNGCQISSPSTGSPTGVDSIERDRDLNPMGARLTPDGRAKLQSLRDEFAGKHREAAVDAYLAMQVGLSKAIVAGNFRYYPKTTQEQDDAIVNETRRASAKLFERAIDENLATMPGASRDTWRIIVLTADKAPDVIATKRRRAALEAEERRLMRALFEDPRFVHP